MTNETPKRRGRPPRDLANVPESKGGRDALHVGIRFNSQRARDMRRVLDDLNRRAREAKLPSATVITLSSVVYSWITERLEQEIAKLDAEEKKRRK